MTTATRRREVIDAPELGASVALVECSVDEVLHLLEIAEDGKTIPLMLAALGASLEVDGKRITETDIRAMKASVVKSLLRLGPLALRVNSIIPEETEDGEKKP
jgi:hypothetical protein